MVDGGVIAFNIGAEDVVVCRQPLHHFSHCGFGLNVTEQIATVFAFK